MRPCYIRYVPAFKTRWAEFRRYVTQSLLDTDPGCDDAVMLAMALGHDAIDVVGLSTVCGNTTIENTTRNAHAILGLGGYDVPVSRGCGRPLVDDLTTAEWIHGENGLHGDIPDADGNTRDTTGPCDRRSRPRDGDELTIAAVGPLPNRRLHWPRSRGYPTSSTTSISWVGRR